MRLSLSMMLLVLCVACGGGSVVSPQPVMTPLRAGVAARGIITHVVVIVQENRTFDDIFGGNVLGSPPAFPGANSLITSSILLAPSGFDTAIPDNDHDVFACLRANGYADETWRQLAAGTWPASPQPCPTTAPPENPDGTYAPDPASLTIIAQNDRVGYWEIAQQYEVGDEFYAVQSSNSFPGHQYVVALSSQNDLGETISDQPHFDPADCGAVVTGTGVKTPVLNLVDGFTVWQPEGDTGLCWDGPTFADRLAAARPPVSWTHYSTDAVSGVFDGFINFRTWYPLTKASGTPFKSSVNAALADFTAGHLSQFTWVKPPCVYFSDHPGTGQSPIGGQDWVLSVINAIGGNAALWPHTAIFVVWDDWGGFYDHAPPLGINVPGTLTPGLREPFLVISPYGSGTGAVHAMASYASVFKFVEDLYGVQPMSSLDANAPDLGAFFNFTKPPAPFRQLALMDRAFDANKTCALDLGIPPSEVDR